MIDAFKLLLDNADKILITTHKSPDGDAIGSAVAFSRFVSAYGKDNHVLLPDAPKENLMSFLDGVPYNFFENFDLTNDSYDLMICLDYNHPHRVGDKMKSLVLELNVPKIMIDHHPNPTEFCDVTISRPEVCSTAQLIYEVLKGCRLDSYLTKEACEALYLGIMTDTGSFRFPSVTSQTHEVLKDLLSKGLEAHTIHERVFDQNTKESVQLRSYAISNNFIQIEGTPIAYITLSQEELKRYDYQKGDTEGLVNVPLTIKGILISIFMKENEDGSIKMSFRSKGKYFVNEFAGKYFAGGGHKYAAGGFSNDGLIQTIDKLILYSKELL
tara:strand:- start:3614 stop:4594 length:981 start_codon:yes stop_codon:yes gene_type:complete